MVHTPPDPIIAFGIADVAEARPGVIVADQYVSAGLADHRGRIDMAALAVLFDHLGGLPFFRYGPDGAPCVQARLAISAQGAVPIGDKVTGTAELLMHDSEFATTRVDVRTSDGRLCCTGTARSVAVGRSATRPPSPGLIGPGELPAVDLPASLPEDLDGRAIVDGLAAGSLAAGPLTELLGGRIEVVEHPLGVGLRYIVRTQPWMANFFGTMHGGVITAITAQACAVAGAANSGRADHGLGDLAIAFLRSPAVQGDEVIVDVEPVKVGRRIGSFRATMRDADGTVLSSSAADTYYRAPA